MPRSAIVALQLKHPEKAVGHRLTWRQAAYLFPSAAISLFLLMSIRFDLFYAHFVSPFTAILLRIITGLVMSAILIGIASVFAFVPVRYLTWLKHIPKKNTDPYDMDQMIDAYILMRLKHRKKTKVLPWRGSDYS